MRTAEERLLKYVDKNGRANENMSRCWKWCGSKEHGYGRFPVNNKKILAHRFSYAIYNPYGITLEDMVGCDCCHECDNRECTNPEHLFLGDRQDNIDDMCEKNRQSNGEHHGHAKLNQAQVIEIRNRYENENITQKQLGIEFGVTPQTIGYIIRNETWMHLTTPDDGNQSEP